jgi:hypothetical protein
MSVIRTIIAVTVMSGMLAESVVGPAPWYWKAFPSFGEDYEWRFIANAGGYPNGNPVLFRNAGSATDYQPVLLVRTYGRALHANVGHVLLWGPRREQNDLLIETFDLSELRPIDVTAKSDAERVWTTTAEPIDRISIPAALPAGRAPGRYVVRTASTLGEVLMLAEGPSTHEAATSIYAWTPATGTVDVMPQPWFNEAIADLGYEWITRVTRDPVSGHIFGDGIRIVPFELDANGALLRRVPNKPSESMFSTWLRALRRGRR